MYIFTYIHIYIYTYIHIYKYTYIQIYIYICVCACIYIYKFASFSFPRGWFESMLQCHLLHQKQHLFYHWPPLSPVYLSASDTKTNTGCSPQKNSSPSAKGLGTPKQLGRWSPLRPWANSPHRWHTKPPANKFPLYRSLANVPSFWHLLNPRSCSGGGKHRPDEKMKGQRVWTYHLSHRATSKLSSDLQTFV